MNVTIHVPPTLRAYSGCDVAELAVSVRTVGAALEELRQALPAVYRGVCDETGAVRRHVNLFVNSALVPRQSALDARDLSPGDVLTIMPAVSGG